jgi:Asp-tRNA(Asn)/Glu-tRNA(Gln) amidotransferase C subunit
MAARAEPVRVTEADVERLAAQVRLAIAPESRAAVAQHLTGLLAAVQLIDELELPEATEPAPRFEP